MGLQPTNKHISWMAVSIDRIEGGKIIEEWGCWDMYGMMQQLGASLPAAA
jgi:predicted ester cyclase